MIERPAEQIGLLMLIGVLINSFAATQDVAVDGMSIDLTPVREQGRLNAFMSFGKAIGWSVDRGGIRHSFDFWGLKPRQILAAAVAGARLLAMLFVLEREGERLLPWTSRPGSNACRSRRPSFARSVRRRQQGALGSGSLVVIAIMFFDGLIYGYGQALMPIAAVNLFGYTLRSGHSWWR